MHIAIYTRISSDPEGLRLGVERQRVDCEHLARHLYPTATLAYYEDNDVSAWSGKRRPEYHRLLDDVATRAVQGLVVYNLDRLHRHPRELEEFIDTCQKVGLVQVHTVAGEIDLSTSDGQLMARVMGAVARKESDDKSRRVKRAMQDLAQQGRPAGGPRAFGYNSAMTALVPSEAQAIQRTVQDLIAGLPRRDAIRHIEAVPRVKSTHPWTVSNIYKLLTHPRIAGLRSHRGTIIGPATWPAIITPEQRQLLLERFARHTPVSLSPARRVPSRHWLSGHAVCGVCGGILHGAATPTRRTYFCARRGCVSIDALYPETFAYEAIVRRLDDPRVHAAITAPATAAAAAARAQLVDIQQRIDLLAGEYAAGAVSTDAWTAAHATLTARAAALRDELTTTPTTDATSPRLLWRNLTVEQRALLARELVHVRVLRRAPGVHGPARVVVQALERVGQRDQPAPLPARHLEPGVDDREDPGDEGVR